METIKTIYGYDIETLRAIALEMNNNDLTVKDLKSSVKMYKKGFEEGFEMCKNDYEKTIEKIKIKKTT